MRWCACAVAVGLVAGPTLAVAAKPVKLLLEASPQQGTITDSYVVTVHIETRGVGGIQRYWHPDRSDFETLDSRTTRSTSMVFDPKHGQQLTTTEVRRYVLRAKRPGRFLIGPAKVRLADDDYETRGAVITVRAAHADVPASTRSGAAFSLGGVDVPGFAPPTFPDGAPPVMFLHLVVDRAQVYVGEQVTATWLLYTRADVLGFEPRPPTLGDFWWEPLFEPRNRLKWSDAYVDRVPYLVSIIAQRALFPVRAGKVPVPEFAAKVATTRSALGQQEGISSSPLTLQVAALPDGAPAGFDRTYVGQFSVDASVDRSHLGAGDSITLTVVVRGQGAIRRTSPPELDIPGFAVTGPREDDPQVDNTGGQVGGERVYRYWLVPERGGELAIPAVVIPYFDPAAAQYRETRSVAIAVTVDGAVASAPGTGTAGTLRENVITRDIRPSVDVDEVHSAVVPRLYRQYWYWLLVVLPAVLFALVVVSDRLRARLRRETPRSRLRRARGRARRRIRVAEIHLRGQRPTKFFGELTGALYDHIEEMVGVSVQSLTRAQLHGFLAEREFPSATIERLERELESCDFARFAPSAAGPGEMKAAMRRVRELLAEVERVRMPSEKGGEQ